MALTPSVPAGHVYPGRQSVHASASLTPFGLMPIVPAGHRIGTTDPTGQYEPSGHGRSVGVGEVEPAVHKNPGLQGVQSVALPLLYVPAGQGIGSLSVVGHL